MMLFVLCMAIISPILLLALCAGPYQCECEEPCNCDDVWSILP